MNVVLWILQGVLAAMFLVAGVLKTTQAREKLQPQMPWVEDVSTPVLRLIGVAELAAAVGLVLPPLTDVAPVLAAWAATGLAVVMVLASGLHLRRKEPAAVVITAVILAMAVVVAWGRFGPHAF
jgi:hypothetical protein